MEAWKKYLEENKERFLDELLDPVSYTHLTLPTKA